MTDLKKLEELIDELEIRDAEIIQLKDEMWDYFENNNVPMHQVNDKGIIIRANNAELACFGYDREDYVGQPIAKFHEDQEVVASVLQRLIDHVEIWQEPANIIDVNGNVVHITLTSSRGKGGLTRCMSMPTCRTPDCEGFSAVTGQCPHRRQKKQT